MLRILITGGAGNLSQIIIRGLVGKYRFFAGIRKNTKDINNLNKISQFAEIIELDLLSSVELENVLNKYEFDILIHAAIVGGRRTKVEDSEIFYKNILMFENILKFSHKFKMILNFDSAAIYDRNTDIFMRKENDITTIPTDYYGLSKYVIYNRSLLFNNIYNLRIFNIFHAGEENDRFIKGCFIAEKNNTVFNIIEDKLFDFFSETDFVNVVDHYIYCGFISSTMIGAPFTPKVMNLSYKTKYLLSDICRLIMGDKFDSLVNINKKFESESNNNTLNYCGNSDILYEFVKHNRFTLEEL